MNRLLAVSAVLLLAAACSKSEPPPPAAATPASAPASAVSKGPAITAMPKFDSAPILDRIKAMSADEFEGRAPGTKGEELTVRYLEDEFKKLGLQPGNTDGTYVQKVPLVGITGDQHAAADHRRRRDHEDLQVEGRGRRLDQARRRRRGDQRLRDDLRRLRRDRARVQLGRLQGRRRQGQDHRRARQRPAGARRRRSREARRQGLQRQGDDLLRPLDLQVRGGREARRGRRPDRARDRPGRLPVPGRAGQPAARSSTWSRPTRTWAGRRSRDGSRSTPRRRS